MKSVLNYILIIFLLLSCSKPDLNVFEGKGVYLDDLRGKWIVFNYWADWCPPCIKEIPDLQKLQSDFQKDVEIFFISVDANFKKTVPKFLKKNKLSGLKVFNDEKLLISKKFDVKIMPTTIIINKNFKESHRVTGYVEWSTKKYRGLIKSLL